MMSKAERESVLTYLFNEYLKTVGMYRINLNPLVKELGEEAITKLKSLENEGVIGHLETLESGTIAMLSYKGAFEANPHYFKQRGDMTISALMHEGEKCHMLLAIGMDEQKISLAFDVVEYLENEGFAKLDKRDKDYTLHLTPKGKEYYYEQQPFFF